jgi:hypothetical protein
LPSSLISHGSKARPTLKTREAIHAMRVVLLFGQNLPEIVVSRS